MKINKLILGIDLIKNMGIKPVAYRAYHVFKKKTGILKKDFPTTYSEKNFISLENWKRTSKNFFFNSKEELKRFSLNVSSKEKLSEEAAKIKEGYIRFFNGNFILLGKDYDWITHPETNYRYNPNQHWSELENLDPVKGDIKYVWEKSRFSWLYTLLRYDYHFEEDQSEFVFSEIISWINSNKLNSGPNYNCSQEISIRVLNWTSALYYYKNAASLTEERFQKIINCIYHQIKHVQHHINFSLLTVRNNHAITESLLLYTTGLLFPFFPESSTWKTKGKKLLEQEGLYQIYEDGSYLQFSMNYERVVLQLYTWAFYLAKSNGEHFSESLTNRLSKAVNFLYQAQDKSTGILPNYGANDGALFFPLNGCSFRDYRPQLNVMHYFLTGKHLYEDKTVWEDTWWFSNTLSAEVQSIQQQSSAFTHGGYYIMRSNAQFAFIRCGNHNDRPSQADNLHLDIWDNGKNIVRDGGSFKYNTTKDEIRYFMGTASHNTVMLNDSDQMQKGGRFMWFFWSQAKNAMIEETDDFIVFTGSIHAFRHLGKNIVHQRTIKQFKNEIRWEIEDCIIGSHLPAKQLWNIHPAFFEDGYDIQSKDRNGTTLDIIRKPAYYSPTYGVKEDSSQLVIETDKNYFFTIIRKK